VWASQVSVQENLQNPEYDRAGDGVSSLWEKMPPARPGKVNVVVVVSGVGSKSRVPLR